MFKRKLSMYIACAIILNPIIISADDIAKQPTLAEHVKNQYLFSAFGKAEEVPATTPDPNANFIEKFKEQINAKTQLLTAREAQEVAFALVSSTQKFETNILDSSCIDKLEIVSGGENNELHLFGAIFKNLNTTIGKAFATLTFCHPTTDLEIIHKRQQAITYLNNHDSILQQLDSVLKHISLSEQKSSMFWHTKPSVNQEFLKYSYFGQQFDIADILKQFNTNTVALEFTNRTYSLFTCAVGLFYIPGVFYYTINQHARKFNIPFNVVYKATIAQLKEFSPIEKVSLIIPVALQGIMAYSTAMTIKSAQEMYNHLQDILIATSTHIKDIKKLNSLLNQNKELLTYLPSLQPLADFNNPAKHSAKLNKLLGMLDTNTFKGQASFFSITGRILAAYELMKQVKDELAPVFAAAGELDMYIALAKLYSDREGKEAQYCMVDFIENSTTPIIKADHFWNPFIDADKVVVNDIIFDTACPNTILTGPNTGGKSTVIKALMIDILMAQTFGIAAAQSFAITPFSKLNCFMNISDDIATGASLFKSEVVRAKKLLDLVQSLKDDEFSFVIIDEVFTGTSPQEGEAAALQFSKKLGSYNNNISIIATHYPKMVNLETETNGRYCNHHVEIIRNEDGSLNRTFKLKNGPTFMNVAFDILEEEGLFV